MEQHAVPRQITTFQFKLIGFLTVKQFIYLLMFTGFAVASYFIAPIILPLPFVDFIAAFIIGGFGAFFSLYKHNERELDVWMKNLINSLLSPSQYYYIKKNSAPDFLKDVFIYQDSATASTHIDASEKLTKYMASTGQQQKTESKKQNINAMIHEKQAPSTPTPSGQQTTDTSGSEEVLNESIPQPQPSAKPTPFLSGVVRNSKNEPLPNIMIYINTESEQVVRILKTNHNGVFATFHPLPSANYVLSPKDLGGNYFFDTMNITVDGKPTSPINIYSKELL